MLRSFGTRILRTSPVEEPLSPRQETGKLPAAVLRLDEHLVCVRSPNSFEADQYRVLRHFVGGSSEPYRRSVVAVTSAAAGEGKTTTAINLAATLAQTPGARVLLIDADLRRPCVGSSLGLPQSSSPGLAGAVLHERLDLAMVVRTTPFNLSILPAGPSLNNAYQILESPRVGQLLAEARGCYDHVVLDTPPLLVVPDCRLLSQWVDGFVIVVAARRTPRKLLAETLSSVDRTKVAGIVFNGDERPLSGYYKGYYTGYYGDHRKGGRRRWFSFWRRRARRQGS